MSDLKVSLTLKLRDALSGPMRTVTRSVNATTTALRKFGRGAVAAGVKIKGLAKQFAEASKGFALSAKLNQAASAVGVVANKLTSFLMAPIEAFEAFEQKMAEVQAVMSNKLKTGDIEKLTATAKRLGFELGEFSMQDVAEGMKIMGMTGMKTEQVLSALEPTLNLSTVAGLGLADTASIMLGIMGGFNIKASESAHVADVLAATFTGSKTTLVTLGETFKLAAATAEEAGLSFEETAIIAGLLGESTIEASMAGTTITAMLNKLIRPVGGAKKALHDMKVEIEDLDTGAMRSSFDIFTDMGEAMKDMGKLKRSAKLNEIFGVRGFKGAAKIMAALGTEKFIDLAESVHAADGTVKRMAKGFRGTAQNETKQFISATETLNTTLGEKLAPTVKIVKDFLKGAVVAIAKWTEKYPTLTKVILIATGVLAIFATILTGLLFTLGSLAALVSLVMAPAFLALLAPIGAAIAAVGAWLSLLGWAFLIVLLEAAGAIGALAIKMWALVGPTLAAAAPFLIVAAAIGAVTLAVVQLVKHWEELDFFEILEGIGAVFSDDGVLGVLGQMFDPTTLLKDMGVIGGEPVDAEAGASNGTNIGGEMLLRIESALPVSVEDISATGPVDIAVDLGGSPAG